MNRRRSVGRFGGATVLSASDSGAVAVAADALRAGELAAFPTETVYGLGADAASGDAVARIFEAKGRPKFNPLIVHVPEPDSARSLVDWTETAKRVAAAFWPGPLTLVLRRTADCPVSELASAGLDSLAVRCPAHPTAHALLTAAGLPVAAPSANRSGRVSPTTAEHVAQELGGAVSVLLDGGPCAVGLESTVLDLTGKPAILRPGAVTREEIQKILGAPVAITAWTGTIASPGQLESHYAPTAPVRLNARSGPVCDGEALLAFGEPAPAGFHRIEQLSARGDLREAAGALFAALRRLDSEGVAGIAAAPVPEHGLGAAINDRLRRAAAPRGT